MAAPGGPWPLRVTINEVGPRDGLQNESGPFGLDERVELVDRLSEAGLPAIEVGGFLPARWSPRMVETDVLWTRIDRRPGTRYQAITPNLRGLEDAARAGFGEVCIFPAASERFSQKNLNQSIDQVMERLGALCAAARQRGVSVRGYVSCCWGCPFGETIPFERVRALVVQQLAWGCHEVSLADTNGVATPDRVNGLLEALCRDVPPDRLALHVHDTCGQAIANVYAALGRGIAVIDSSIAGLGGCPYAPGATGNVATEDVVYLLDGMGIETGLSLSRLAPIGQWICGVLGRDYQARAGKAWLARQNAA